MNAVDLILLFSLNKGGIIDFHDTFILKGFPLEGFNILEDGPYEVTEANPTTYTKEYTLQGGKGVAFLEVEKKGNKNIILIQTEIVNFPSVFSKLKNTWKSGMNEFEFNGVKYYLVDEGEEEDDGEECHYWDYYSDPINDGNKLFIGVQDYGDEGEPELEFCIGFEIPERAIKEILQG